MNLVLILHDKVNFISIFIKLYPEGILIIFASLIGRFGLGYLISKLGVPIAG